ncbi:MAG: hypothetical protein P4L46_11765 [Fimbriimonas sp.]|nr:hypothetical protein [Fimbriimonas sp.]
MIFGTPIRPDIVVHPDRVLRHDLDRFFGIDLNYIRDADANRPSARPLADALKDMGVRWLRFPGGEKSNFHLWSSPPYKKAEPISLGWYATVQGKRMDFDAYIQLARSVGCEPFVVVGFDAEKQAGRTSEQWLENAVSWVRYSQVTKKYGVRYWEIGNENWNHKLDPLAVAETVKRFSRAMKAIDPTIQVGASGDNDGWWSTFLPSAAPYIDFLSVSLYTGWEWGSYARFLTKPDLIETARTASQAIDRYAPPAERSRLRVVVAETNAKDYSEGGWPDQNDIGHALVTFATLGHLAEAPRVASAMVWTTRWMDDDKASSSPFYALGPRNDLHPTGRALALWGQFAEPVMLATTDDDVYASRSKDGKRMTVWLANRELVSRDVNVRIDGTTSYMSAAVHVFWGKSDGDLNPHWDSKPDTHLHENRWSGTLPPLSVTVLTLASTGR